MLKYQTIKHNSFIKLSRVTDTKTNKKFYSIIVQNYYGRFWTSEEIDRAKRLINLLGPVKYLANGNEWRFQSKTQAERKYTWAILSI